MVSSSTFFFFNDTATTEIYTLSLHDALPISAVLLPEIFLKAISVVRNLGVPLHPITTANFDFIQHYRPLDRKSTRLNSSHGYISYAVFCLKKQKPDHCLILW